MYHKIYHCTYQKPHHKYMFPHLSSNHLQHIFRHHQDWDNTIQQTVKDQRRLQLYTQTVYFTTHHTPITQTNLLQKTLSHGYLTTITNDDNLPTKHTTTITNLQSTTAANTTNTLELTKLYVTSYTNTTTCISPNWPKLTATPLNSTLCYSRTNSYTQKLSNLNNFSTQQLVYTLFYTCYTHIHIYVCLPIIFKIACFQYKIEITRKLPLIWNRHPWYYFIINWILHCI